MVPPAHCWHHQRLPTVDINTLELWVSFWKPRHHCLAFSCFPSHALTCYGMHPVDMASMTVLYHTQNLSVSKVAGRQNLWGKAWVYTWLTSHLIQGCPPLGLGNTDWSLYIHAMYHDTVMYWQHETNVTDITDNLSRDISTSLAARVVVKLFCPFDASNIVHNSF